MTRTERIVGILAVAVAALVSVATKPRRTGWRSPATPVPQALRLTPEKSEAVLTFRADLNAHARGLPAKGKKSAVPARQIDVRLEGTATWVGEDASMPPTAVKIFVSTPAVPRGHADTIQVYPGSSGHIWVHTSIPVDPNGTRCPIGEPCIVEFDVEARWLDPSVGAMDLDWTMTATALGFTHSRRDKKPPPGAKMTVREAP